METDSDTDEGLEVLHDQLLQGLFQTDGLSLDFGGLAVVDAE